MITIHQRDNIHELLLNLGDNNPETIITMVFKTNVWFFLNLHNHGYVKPWLKYLVLIY
jgi:hypothetical protein